MFLCTAASPTGGTEAVVMRVAEGLCARGHSVQVAFPLQAQGWLNHEAAQHTRFADCRWTATGSLLEVHEPRHLRDMRALRRYVLENRVDVANIHYGVSHISTRDVVALRMAGARVVVSSHHLDPQASRARRSSVLAAWLSHAVIVTTITAKRRLTLSGVLAGKIAVVPLGVDHSRPSITRERARQQLGLTADDFVVGSVARLVLEKGIMDLIAAVGAASGDPHLIVAGEGPARGDAEVLASARLGSRCQLLGRVDDPGLVYAAADIFVLPSHEEGFGLVYLEAAVYGVPSIGCNVGGVAEAILDGETGLLVPSGDVQRLTRAIDRLRSDGVLRNQMGSAARNRVARGFTNDVMVDGYARALAL